MSMKFFLFSLRTLATFRLASPLRGKRNRSLSIHPGKHFVNKNNCTYSSTPRAKSSYCWNLRTGYTYVQLVT
ncbi:hypothetical protein R3P38DRAFT_2910432 [Favolaschia claudopus]|uniref:Secreted protein n=1 Tax=Favolaschia claudopus TaxID=2862362 RepID=A0AAW0CD36_9AGAR